jgi:hypothetical protein
MHYQYDKSSNTDRIGFLIPFNFLTGVLKKFEEYFYRIQKRSPSVYFSLPKVNYFLPSSQ